MKEPSIETVSKAVLDSIEKSEELTLADEDFAGSNFSFEEEIDEARIYMDDGREIGIFYLKSDADTVPAERDIENYLESEQESLSSLLTLYPSQDLSQKLERYKSAMILKKGRYLCYLILNTNELSAAEQAFKQAF